jgi:hypothetical protein
VVNLQSIYIYDAADTYFEIRVAFSVYCCDNAKTKRLRDMQLFTNIL